ncbi:MAG TPA: sodium:solute symporter family protein, partial [Methanoculleus sp.]|nr:sodium:solute symporter family protein [Methanoculleus sp.]
MAVDTGLFIAITLVYLVAVISLGYLGYRRTKGEDDYLVAGRRVHPVVLALSYGATFISTSAIIGFGGVAAQLGMGMIWLTVLNIGLG